MSRGRDIYEIGEIPRLGEAPPRYMYAQLIRRSRYGEPRQAFQIERVEVPNVKADEVLVYVMAAGVNYNNVWVAMGVPEDVIGRRCKSGEAEDFHIGGSDASGIVYAIGSSVKNVKVGDEVVIHCGVWKNEDDPSPSIWGYDINWGSFAQFSLVKSYQCLPKAKHLTWEESAAPMLVGATTYKMLCGWSPNNIKPGDVVLIWGGAGGLGSMAIQLARIFDGIPVAVVTSKEKADYCLKLGAAGCIDRNRYKHWGPMPHWRDERAYAGWLASCRQFRRDIWKIVGGRKDPAIVFEHPGEDTVATSMHVCDAKGMVVTCAATSGFTATLDLRQLWVRQKRFQGSHFADQEHCVAFNDLVREGKIDPCLHKTFEFSELALAHQYLRDNRDVFGKFSVLVGAPAAGCCTLSDSDRQSRDGLSTYSIIGESIEQS